MESLGTIRLCTGAARSLRLLCAIAVLCWWTACGSEPPRRPNVLLISIDTLRADHLHCYGYTRQTSPNLDALAREGVLFERAVSTTSWTLPAHLSMLTGLPISAHGACDDRLWDRRDAQGERIEPPLRGTFVSEHLQAAGYSTAGFFTWKYLEDQFGFGPGFDVWERSGMDFFSHPEIGQRFLELRQAGNTEGMRALAAEHPELLDPARRTSPETIDRALEWLDGQHTRAPDRPFFLFVHLFDVHDPYLPPKEFDRFGDPDYTGPIDGTRVTSPDSPVHAAMATPDLERLVSLYDGGIAFVDAQVERLIVRLDELELADDTLVMVTSDHGEEFFEHGHKTHRRQLYVESVVVPLIMRWPAGLPKGGRRVAGTVGLIDLTPTILSATGVGAARPLPGADLLAIARGEEANAARTYTSLLYLFEGGQVRERQLGLFLGDEHVLLSNEPTKALRGLRFDLEHDPRELAGDEIGGEEPSRRALCVRLDHLRATFGALRADLPERGATLPPLSALDKSQLAAMGYAGQDDETRATQASERLCLDGCVWWLGDAATEPR